MMRENEALKAQRNEITEHAIYKKLARKDKKNGALLERIADDEMGHYNVWKAITKREAG